MIQQVYGVADDRRDLLQLLDQEAPVLAAEEEELLDEATRVAAESPELYYEIQSLNQYGTESLTALRMAVERLCEAVRHDDAPAFVSMMQRGHEYLRVRQAARELATA